MRLALALLALLASLDSPAFFVHLVPNATVVEYRNRLLDHFFLTADPLEAAGIDAGAAYLRSAPARRTTGTPRAPR